MTASDLIRQLQDAVEKHGDHELLFSGNYGEETYDQPEISCRPISPLWRESQHLIVLNFNLGS